MTRIELTQGYFSEVDDSDAELLSKYRWKILKADGQLYAARTHKKTQTILMHRFLLNAGKNQVVDHRNGDGLDNKRKNIRLGTQGQNLANMRKTRGKSRYKGVYWNSEKNLWQVQIGAGKNKNGNQLVIYLGRFKSEIEAAKAYDSKALEMHKDFARLNFSK